MSLDSSSTLQNAVDQYLDNLAWDNNVAKARLALEAIRFIEATRPIALSAGTGNQTYESMIQQRARIEAFLDLADTANRPTAHFVRGRAIL